MYNKDYWIIKKKEKKIRATVGQDLCPYLYYMLRFQIFAVKSQRINLEGPRYY